ncbi:class III lanthionine synthetase LanKC [Massilia sp. erpn]|uniref:class III lanthionine synthetase LanKC n=1 Tax=Massilia sp. erpn TaxID=2738142 RepID=UPI0021067DBD|nr:class III lanthionine synthetase LanKC [Massilia sp. erpn]UTY60537.1 protein kinase/lanthionine synthetase C family protein [Massilia sp. erpn]
MVKKLRGMRDLRHIDKIAYLRPDKRFYEPGYAHYKPTEELIELVRPMLEGQEEPWKIHRADVWTHILPASRKESNQLPVQGWKIHVSAIEANCRDLLAKVAGMALENNIQFKFANDIETLKMMTSKRWSRGGSGKFITLYPPTDEKFQEIIEKAYLLLKDDVGSYILSDRRYKDCRCLYYRYGGIISVNKLLYTSEKQPVIFSPDGEQIPDHRTPYFETPPWAADPFPEEQPDYAEFTLNSGRYLVKEALGFSNTGGVYLSTEVATGRQVVIKEARPYIELGENNTDSVSRLVQEEKILRALTGTGLSPEIYDSFQDWENYYLVEEYFPAPDIRVVMLESSPLVNTKPAIAVSENFYHIYKKVFISALRGMARIHELGIIIGDVSPKNMLVDRESLTVRFIDLEGAFRPGVDEPQRLHTPGFRIPSKGRELNSSYEDDTFAIGVIMMYAIFPIAAMQFLREDLFTAVLPKLVTDVGWSNTPVLSIITQLVDNKITCKQAADLLENSSYTIDQPIKRHALQGDAPMKISDQMARFIASNYRLDKIFTVFPVDPFGQRDNPTSFGFGSTGVIHALSQCGYDIPPAALARHRGELADLKLEDITPGFLVGTSGIAWCSLMAGDRETAERLLQHANHSPLTYAHHSLYFGMAGIGMANLAAYLSLKDPQYLEAALRLAVKLAEQAKENERGVYWEEDGRVWIGFGYGQSGIALFLLRLSQISGEDKWRDMGKKAVLFDMSWGRELEPGNLTVAANPEDTTTYEHYIEEGSAGIIKVAIRYGLWDDTLEAFIGDIDRKYASFAGLIFGLAGFADVLIDAYRYSLDEKYLAMADSSLQGIIDLYLLKYDDGYATPGENLFRITCDYATGVAGIMRTFHRRANPSEDEFCLDELDRLPPLFKEQCQARHDAEQLLDEPTK